MCSFFLCRFYLPVARGDGTSYASCACKNGQHFVKEFYLSVAQRKQGLWKFRSVIGIHLLNHDSPYLFLFNV